MSVHIFAYMKGSLTRVVTQGGSTVCLNCLFLGGDFLILVSRRENSSKTPKVATSIVDTTIFLSNLFDKIHRLIHCSVKKFQPRTRTYSAH